MKQYIGYTGLRNEWNGQLKKKLRIVRRKNFEMPCSEQKNKVWDELFLKI
jgi:hypothetical protein